jgi:SAM-dependent methyltransferase
MTRVNATLERLRPFRTLPFRASDFAGTRASRLGERHGWDWLTYNPMTMWSYHRMARRDAPPVIASLAGTFPEAGSYLDVGAGSGAFAAEARRRGKAARALERSRVGRALARAQGVPAEEFDLTDLRPDIPGADLAYSFEVAEHLPGDLGDRLVSFLAAAAPCVVFTAAPPGQGGCGHVNEQPPSYWIERFRAAGMEHSPEQTEALRRAFRANGVHAPWFDANVQVFRRAQG